VPLFVGFCLDSDDLKRVHRKHGYVLDDRMRPRQRVRWRRSAARYLFLQPRLFLCGDDNRELRWCHWHVSRVWIWLQLRWE
jgi:hypothetical protein